MKDFALSIGGTTIPTISGIPSGGLFFTGQNVIGLIINALLVITILLSLFFFVWGGIRWTISGGKKEELQKVHTTLIYAIVGLVIAFLAFFIIGVIQYFFGVTLLRSNYIP